MRKDMEDMEASPEDTTEMMPDKNHDMVNNNENHMQDKQRSMEQKNMKVCLYLWIILTEQNKWTFFENENYSIFCSSLFLNFLLILLVLLLSRY